MSRHLWTRNISSKSIHAFLSNLANRQTTVMLFCLISLHYVNGINKVMNCCANAWTVKRLSTSWNCVNQSRMSHHLNIFDPPPNSSWSYRVTSSAPMADGLSVWLVRRSGIPCRTACGIRLLAGTVSDNLWRRFCSQRTDEFSAL